MNRGHGPSLPLRPDRALLHEEGACLPLRSRHGRCKACESACPSAALSVTLEAVTLSDACNGCGRCTAACPTQALGLPELAALEQVLPAAPASAAAPGAVLRIECRRVPAARLQPGSLVVPCLGALTPGHLLERAAAGVSVRVIDRGWCEHCESGCSVERPAHPAAPALEVAASWLDAVGESTATATMPLLEREPLPARLAASTAAVEAAPALDRRRFFRAVVERPAGRSRPGANPMGGDGRAAYPADARHPSPERMRQHTALQALSALQRTPVPAEFYPRLQAAPSCCDHRMCVALCPTAALSVDEDGSTSRLQFDAARCIACGTCERACPEGSLALTAHGGVDGVQTLARHRRLRCRTCGETFPSTREEQEPAAPLCPTCIKSQRFIDDARRQLFGALN